MTPPDQMAGPPEGGWESLKVDELRDELEARGLPKSGMKAELVERLEDDEVAQEGAAPAEELKADEVVEAEAEEAPEAEAAEEEAAEAEEEAADEEAAQEALEAEEAPEDEVAEAEPAEEEAAEAEAPARRRGSVETGAQPRKAVPRREDGAVVVAARAKYVRSAPRKARLVMDHIRGKRVEDAQAILRFAPRAVSGDILKLLNSAVANAESAYELGADELRVRRAFVDEGPTIKRFRPRALGRATRINKRTSHMTIELTTEGNGR
jgi:large subunit ribosomal protein L22